MTRSANVISAPTSGSCAKIDASSARTNGVCNGTGRICVTTSGSATETAIGMIAFATGTATGMIAAATEIGIGTGPTTGTSFGMIAAVIATVIATGTATMIAMIVPVIGMNVPPGITILAMIGTDTKGANTIHGGIAMMAVATGANPPEAITIMAVVIMAAPPGV